MRLVFYFGQSQTCPIIDQKYNLSNVIKCVNFNPEELMKMESEEEQEVYQDYIQMIKHIDPRKLKFKKVTCGYKSVILLDDKNEMWGFGQSLNGQLGTNKMKYNVNRPFNVSRLSDKYFVNVAVSQSHTLAISNTEKLFAWGSTEFGCLGQEMKEIHQYSMTKIRKNLFVSSDESFQRRTVYDAIACGEHFSLLICNDKLLSFGKDDKGRLGCGQKNISYTQKPLQIQLPLTVKSIKGVTCGKNHCLIWDQDGLIYSWGDGSDGKLGHSSVNGAYNYMIVDPQQIKALEEHRIIQASCGYRHSCAITYKGEIFTWGRTVYYKHEKRKELPLDYLRPKKISSFFHSENKTISAGAIFVKISSHAYHNAAVDQKGFLYTWGQNKENCLGHENSNDINYPICVEEFTSMKVVDVACGHHFTVVISTKANNHLAYKNLKEFRLNLLKNATQNIAKIKEYCDSKLNKKFDQDSNSNLHSRASSVSWQKTPKQLHSNNNKNNNNNYKQESDEIIESNRQQQTNVAAIKSPPLMMRSISQPVKFSQSNKSIIEKSQAQINPHLKLKYNELMTTEKLFKQNINNGLMKLENEQKRILNQRPLTSKPQQYFDIIPDIQGYYLSFFIIIGHTKLNIKQLAKIEKLESISKPTEIKFEYQRELFEIFWNQIKQIF